MKFLRLIIGTAILGPMAHLLGQSPTLMNKAIITTNAIVGAVGTPVPFTEFEVDSSLTTSPRGILTGQFSTGTDGARLHMRKARGTRASPTVVVTGDNLGRIVGTGYDGTNYLENANITFGTEGTIAATRVPTNITFSTATNATPSVVTLAATINSSQQFVNNVGSAAAPSYTFAGDTDTGLYWNSSNTLGFAANGAATGYFGTASGFRIGNANVSGTRLDLLDTGAVALVAGGTNQSIALTPSGTGTVVITGTPGGTWSGLSIAATDASQVQFTIGNSTGNQTQIITSAAGATRIRNTAGSQPITFELNSEKARFAATTGNLLLGGLTTDGTGVLQFPAASTSAGGITFGTDVNLYRRAAGTLSLNYTAGAGARFSIEETGVASLQITASSGICTFNSTGNSLVLQSASTTALTLDSSQNAQLAKLITSYNGIATAGNGVSTVQGAGSVTAQTAAVSSIAAYTVGASDADFIVSGQVTVTASATNSFSLECAYTDAATNTARVVTFNVQQLTGTLITSITNVTGVGPYEGVPLHLRAKASTSITIRTNSGGTYTSVTYAASGVIQKLQ